MKRHFVAIMALLVCAAALPAHALDFSAHGYYRVRLEYTHDLDLQTPNPGIVPADATNDSNDRFGAVAFGQQRFRLNPHLKINDHISIHGQMDVFDNLLFGQSDIRSLTVANPVVGTLALPDANGPYGLIGTTGGDVLGSGGGNINARRLWVDILTSGGQFRIGRQPSHFGLGIYTNDGDAVEGDFGDTYDRIMYLAGIELNKGDRINFGVAYDFAYEGQHDPSLFGLDDSEPSNWNDGYQGGAFVMYQAEAWELGLLGGIRYRNGTENAYTTTATYIDNCADDGRPASAVCANPADTTDPAYDFDNDGSIIDGVTLPAGKDGNTLIYIADLYGKFRFAKNYSIGFEGVYVGGKIATGVAVDTIVLDDASQVGITNPLTDPIELPLTGTQNNVQALLGALEFDADWDFGGEAHIQAGYASGDDKPLSEKITQLGFRPDYDIALILFDQPIGTSPAIVVGSVTELGRKAMSPNYVNNAIYFTAEYKHEFDIRGGVPWAEDFKIGIKGITAYAPNNNLDLNFNELAPGQTTLPYLLNASRWYGWEVDTSLEATFFEALKWRTVLGVFVPGPLYDIKNDNGANNGAGIISPILPDQANLAFAGKTTLFFEF